MTKTTTTRVLGLNHIYIPGLAAGNLGDIGVKSFDPNKLAGNMTTTMIIIIITKLSK